MKRREFMRQLGGAPMFLSARAPWAGEIEVGRAGFNVRQFGAAGDGKRLETKVLQRAIDQCAQAGGGTVWFPAGVYRSGTLRLRSRVTLHLEAGAVLLGSQRLEDYPSNVPTLRSYTDNYTERSLLYGEGLESVAIEGRGTIEGQGAAFPGPYKTRPYLIRLVSCRGIAVTDVTLRDSPMWVQHYLGCDQVRLEGLTVRSRVNQNNDGIDIDACRRVRIANCDISSGDDALVLKSTLDRPCEDVVVSNCVLSSNCNAFKLGTESNGGFQNIAVSNCAIYDTRLAGLALELVDGGLLERVSISNVTMRRVSCPIFVRLGNRGRPFKAGMANPGQGHLRNLSLSHVRADGANAIGCSITGQPGRPAEDVALEDIQLTFAGGGEGEATRTETPEYAAQYPEYSMFGSLPAYGLYCRHLRGLRLRDVRVGWVEPEARPSLVCDEVEDLDLFGWRARAVSGQQPVVRFRNVRDAFVHGCRSPRGTDCFLRVEGNASSGIRLLDNDLTQAKQAAELGAEAPSEAVKF
jgi:Glycosyl hydrolases family 28